MATEAELIVNKMGAATRQLNAAIRMFFLEEDELAIHTIASAAYGIISDIKSKRGGDESIDPWAYGVFRVCKDYFEGEISKEYILEMGDEAWELVESWLPIFEQNPSIKFSEIEVLAPKNHQANYWREFRKSANFLKHADRDEHGSLVIKNVDNVTLLTLCFSALMHMNIKMSLETQVYYFYLCTIELFDPELVKDSERELIEVYKSVDPDKLKRFCYEYILKY